MKQELKIVPFEAMYAQAFKDLNLAWIETYFTPEIEDFKVLNHPQTEIIDKGGYIAFVQQNERLIGTAALKKIDNETYELVKMGVLEAARGLGAGKMLGYHLIEVAKAKGAKKIVLESNKVLVPAIHLYQHLGFKETPMMVQSAYSRADYYAVLSLVGDES